MSHTTSIKAIKIQSLSALRAAVAELNGLGVNCSIEENATPRAYFPDQPGLGLAPYVIRLRGSRYDIGLYPDGANGFEARTDFWGQDVEKLLGAPARTEASKEQAKLGRLFQTYGVHAAMEQARRKGHNVRRTTNTDGSVKLVVTGV